MIKLENVKVCGLARAIYSARNAYNSWDKSDSDLEADVIGDADMELALKLAKGGSVHAKYRRMIVVYVDITAPLYWWKEADTYKVGTVANSCSTMHKIHAKEFEITDFSFEQLTAEAERHLQNTIDLLNEYRLDFISTKEKRSWWQMIQLLPSSYNQKRTLMLNYEVLNNIYFSRKGHRLTEWEDFRKWIETLPYSELITVEEKERK